MLRFNTSVCDLKRLKESEKSSDSGIDEMDKKHELTINGWNQRTGKYVQLVSQRTSQEARTPDAAWKC